LVQIVTSTKFTHIEGEFGNDEGTNPSEGRDLGVTTLDEIKDGLELVHGGFDCLLATLPSWAKSDDDG